MIMILRLDYDIIYVGKVGTQLAGSVLNVKCYNNSFR